MVYWDVLADHLLGSPSAVHQPVCLSCVDSDQSKHLNLVPSWTGSLKTASALCNPSKCQPLFLVFLVSCLGTFFFPSRLCCQTCVLDVLPPEFWAWVLKTETRDLTGLVPLALAGRGPACQVAHPCLLLPTLAISGHDLGPSGSQYLCPFI